MSGLTNSNLISALNDLMNQLDQQEFQHQFQDGRHAIPKRTGSSLAQEWVYNNCKLSRDKNKPNPGTDLQ